MDILTALSTDHSPILFSLSKNIDISRGKGLWKFNKSFCHKLDFVTELKNHLKVICNRMSSKQITTALGVCKILNKKIFYLLFKRKYQKKKTLAKTVTLENKLEENKTSNVFLITTI